MMHRFRVRVLTSLVAALVASAAFVHAVDPDAVCMLRTNSLFPSGFLSDLPMDLQGRIQGDCAYPRIALVLSGGGARGLAHIPIIEAVERVGIPVDMVVGTSMGALVGSLYAAGYSPGDIRRLLESQDLVSLFLESPLPRTNGTLLPGNPIRRNNVFSLSFDLDGIGGAPALIGDQRIVCLLHDVFSRVAAVKDFDDLIVPFRCVGTDVLTGERLVFESGSLADAVRASIAIPVVFAPYPVGGRYVVDGGIVDNLPIQVARDMGADLVIAVDVNASSHADSMDDLDSVTAMIAHTLSLVVQNTVNRQLQQADLLIEPDLGSIGILDFFNVSEILDAGRIAAWEHRTALARIASQVALYRPLNKMDPSRYGSYFLLPDVYIRSVAGFGFADGDAGTVFPWASALEGKPLDDVRKQILRDRLYDLRSRGLYTGVSYEFEPVETSGPAGYVAGDIRINARSYKQKPASIQTGFRFAGSLATRHTTAPPRWMFAPHAVASLSYEDIFDSSISFDAAVSYRDLWELSLGLAYTGWVGIEPQLAIGYSVGFMDPSDRAPSPYTVSTLDRAVSCVLSCVIRPAFPGLVVVPALDFSMVFQEAPETIQPEGREALPFALVPLVRTDLLWTTRDVPGLLSAGTSVDIACAWGRTTYGPVWGVSASVGHVFDLSEAWAFDLGLTAGSSRYAVPAAHLAFDCGGARGMAGYGTGSLVEECVFARMVVLHHDPCGIARLSLMTGFSVGSRSPFAWEAGNTMDIPAFALLQTPEAGMMAGLAWESSSGTLLAGVSASLNGRTCLFLEFL